jgi:RimJ/RimL family protein N-acetyltransferase
LTAARGDLVIRPIASAKELDLFCGLRYTLDHELAHDLARGLRRPEWMWVALRDGRLVARAAWWGSAGDGPSVLDFLDVGDEPDRIDLGVRLVEVALRRIIPPRTRPPEYVRFVPPDWHDQPSSRRVVADLMDIAGRLGAELVAERLRFEWRRGMPIPGPAGRLVFRASRDETEWIDLMAQVMDGTLDAHGRRDLARMPAQEAAAQHFGDELARYRSPREWWQVATRPAGPNGPAGPAGDPVGFVFPARNSYGAIIAYIGVLPAHRGHGYIHDILAAGTRILAAQDVPRIRATTDVGNTPMAAAFTRGGWVNFERSITMAWP